MSSTKTIQRSAVLVGLDGNTPPAPGVAAIGVNDSDALVWSKADGSVGSINATITSDTGVISNVSDASKQLGFSLGGATASTKTTFVLSQTAARSITFPDATDTLVGKATTDTLTNKTLSGATVVSPVNQSIVAVQAVTGNTIHAGVVAWQNPESGSIIIHRIVLDLTTVATLAASLDVGTTAVNATTASDNLLDGIDIHTGTGLFSTADGDATNAKAQQKLAAGKWVTLKEISGDASGAVGRLYIHYTLLQ